MPLTREEVVPFLVELAEKSQSLVHSYELASRSISNRTTKLRCIFLWQVHAELVSELNERLRWFGAENPLSVPPLEESDWSVPTRLTRQEVDLLLLDCAEGDEEVAAAYDEALRFPLPIDVQMLLMRHRERLRTSEKTGLLDHLAQSSHQRDMLAQAVHN